MADPHWIKKTILLTIVLAGPACPLLVSVWRDHVRLPDRSSRTSTALFLGALVLAFHVAWFLNVTFELSAMFMVMWPLIGILLSVLGCGISFLVKNGARAKLLGANALLLLLSLTSIVAPN